MARTAKAMSIDALKGKILSKINTDSNWPDDEHYSFLYGIAHYFESNQVLQKDLAKIQFDWENYGDENWSEEICGFHTLPNGFTFYGMWAGGDWEHPVFFIIYWSGSRLRAYIPEDGNCFNADERSAYGNEDTYSEDSKYKDFDIDKISEEYDDNIEENVAKILADIQNRIQLL